MITFYPTISRGELGKYCTVPRMLLVASSFAAEEVRKYGRVRGAVAVPVLPPCAVDVAADCGGFVATFRWGDYRYTAEQYVAWLSAWKPSWAAMMDYCCEDEITTGQPGIVRERQDKTTAMAHLFWERWHDAPWVWVPTIQGWTVADYERHAVEMRPLIDIMRAHYGPDSAFRVGVGTLCHRASVEMIRAVVRSVHDILDNPLHLWGVKLSILKSPIPLPQSVISVDSAAWNGLWGNGRNLWKETGMTQRQWRFETALPRYEGKLRRALALPKQYTPLWESEAAL